jgi:hypothetical protein
MICLITHAERTSDMNAHHTQVGVKNLIAVAETLFSLLGQSGKLHRPYRVMTGNGHKYQDIQNIVLAVGEDHGVHIDAEHLELCPIIGGSESRIGNGSIISATGAQYACYRGLAYLGAETFWNFLEEVNTPSYQNIILCSGKQFMTALGGGEQFSKASLYELFPASRKILLLAKGGCLVI